MSRPFRDLSPAQSYFCDAARFIAALAVALHHSFDAVDFEPYNAFSRVYHANLGSLGVALFFLLSGFLIAHTALRKSSRGGYSFGRYFVERSVRIYLVYLPAILLAVLVAAFAGTLFVSEEASLRRLLLNLTMLQGVAPLSEHAETFALLGPSWTLNYEYWFYMLFGLTVVGWSSGKWRWLWLALAIPVGLLLLQLHHVWDLGALWFAGAAIAFLFQRVRLSTRSGVALALGAAVVASVIFLAAPIDRAADVPIAKATMTVIFLSLVLSLGGKELALEQQDVETSLTGKLASYSYSLYITHVIFLAIFDMLFDPQIAAMRQSIGLVGAALVLLIGVNIGAYLFSWLSEQHNGAVRSWLLRGKPRAKPGPAVAAAPS